MSLKILRQEELGERICIVVGTRPSIVKQSPIIRELQRRELDFFVLHTGQHYSPELDSVFFRDLRLPEPKRRLVGIKEHKLHGAQTAEMLRQTEQVLIEEKPRVVLVGGDANSNLAAALAGRKLNLIVAHDESGVRGFQWNVPEEHNRVIMDHISDYLFAPSESARLQLEREAVRGTIVVTGSTAVDAVQENFDLAIERSRILDDLQLAAGSYAVMTTHHEENVDYVEELTAVIEGVEAVTAEHSLRIVFPVHPRTSDRLRRFDLHDRLAANPLITLTDPLGYLDFLALVGNAKLVISDSGGLIQESAIHGVPCLTVGKFTEWTEVVEAGANIVSHNDPETMASGARTLLRRKGELVSPFVPGASRAIVDILASLVGGREPRADAHPVSDL